MYASDIITIITDLDSIYLRLSLMAACLDLGTRRRTPGPMGYRMGHPMGQPPIYD